MGVEGGRGGAEKLLTTGGLQEFVLPSSWETVTLTRDVFVKRIRKYLYEKDNFDIEYFF
jgi:hypothetical protein